MRSILEYKRDRNGFTEKMKEMFSMKNDKRGQSGGVVGGIVFGIMGLFIGIIVSLIVIQTLSNANLLGTGTVESTAVSNTRGNISAGIEQLNTKIPTVFTIGAVVLILAILLIIVVVAKKLNSGGGAGGNL